MAGEHVRLIKAIGTAGEIPIDGSPVTFVFLDPTTEVVYSTDIQQGGDLNALDAPAQAADDLGLILDL